MSDAPWDDAYAARPKPAVWDDVDEARPADHDEGQVDDEDDEPAHGLARTTKERPGVRPVAVLAPSHGRRTYLYLD
jgi:hypothetical protein